MLNSGFFNFFTASLPRVAPRTAAQRYPLGLHSVSSAGERGGVVGARQPLPLRALGCSADLQSAVSPNCIRRPVGSVPSVGVFQTPAECNSAIQQSTTLRCDAALNTYLGERIQVSGLPENTHRDGRTPSPQPSLPMGEREKKARRRRQSRFVWAICAFTALTALAAAAPLRPNIVFILADDLGPNDLARYGRHEHHTPNLDRGPPAGARFPGASAAQPICSPSRAAIMTGKAPARLHLTTYLPGRPDCASQKLLHPVIEQQLPLAEKTLAECLRDAGYATACIGKWHLGGAGFLPTDQGFDFYHPGNAVPKPSATEGGKGEYDLPARAIEFMETHRERPFFVYRAHNSPHIPYAAKAELVTKNAGAFEPVYAALIETLDDTVGLLLAKLDALGLRERTLGIFTSDHGGLHVPEGPHARITHNTPFRAGKG